MDSVRQTFPQAEGSVYPGEVLQEVIVTKAVVAQRSRRTTDAAATLEAIVYVGRGLPAEIGSERKGNWRSRGRGRKQ